MSLLSISLDVIGSTDINIKGRSQIVLMELRSMMR